MSDAEFAARMEMENGKGYQFGKTLGYAIASMVPFGMTLMYGVNRQHLRRSEERLNSMIAGATGAEKTRLSGILETMLNNSRAKPADESNFIVSGIDNYLIGKGYTEGDRKKAIVGIGAVNSVNTNGGPASPLDLLAKSLASAEKAIEDIGTNRPDINPTALSSAVGRVAASKSNALDGNLIFDTSTILAQVEEDRLGIDPLSRQEQNQVKTLDASAGFVDPRKPEDRNASGTYFAPTQPPLAEVTEISADNTLDKPKYTAKEIQQAAEMGIKLSNDGAGVRTVDGLVNAGVLDDLKPAVLEFSLDGTYGPEQQKRVISDALLGKFGDAKKQEIILEARRGKYGEKVLIQVNDYIAFENNIKETPTAFGGATRANIDQSNAARAAEYDVRREADITAKAKSWQRKLNNEAANRQMTEDFSYTPPPATPAQSNVTSIATQTDNAFTPSTPSYDMFGKPYPNAFIRGEKDKDLAGDSALANSMFALENQFRRDLDLQYPPNVNSIPGVDPDYRPESLPPVETVPETSYTEELRENMIPSPDGGRQVLDPRDPRNQGLGNVPEVAGVGGSVNYNPRPINAAGTYFAPKNAIDGPFAGFPSAPTDTYKAPEGSASSGIAPSIAPPKQTTNVSTQGQNPPIQTVADPRSGFSGDPLYPVSRTIVDPDASAKMTTVYGTSGDPEGTYFRPTQTEAALGKPKITESQLKLAPTTSLRPTARPAATSTASVQPKARPTPNTGYQDFANRLTPNDGKEYVNNVLVDKDGNRINNLYQDTANALTGGDGKKFVAGVLIDEKTKKPIVDNRSRSSKSNSTSSRITPSASSGRSTSDVQADINAEQNRVGKGNWSSKLNTLVKERDNSTNRPRIPGGTIKYNAALDGNNISGRNISGVSIVTPSPKSNNNDSSSKSSNKAIVCTEMYRQTELADWQQAMKIWHVYQERYLTIHHQVGYHWLFQPYVKGMKNSSILTKLGSALAKHRTQHLRYVLTKGKAKDDLLGNIWCKFIHPIVYVAGIIKEKVGK